MLQHTKLHCLAFCKSPRLQPNRRMQCISTSRLRTRLKGAVKKRTGKHKFSADQYNLQWPMAASQAGTQDISKAFKNGQGARQGAQHVQSCLESRSASRRDPLAPPSRNSQLLQQQQHQLPLHSCKCLNCSRTNSHQCSIHQ
jgi:hypothetical protein